MYLLDTDIVIWILRAHPALLAFLTSLVEKTAVGVSAMTVGEVYQHIFPTEMSTAEFFFDQHKIFPVSREIAKEAGLYWQQYHKKLLKLSIGDCIIAATAKLHGLTVYTLNLRHFPMSDIVVRKPPRLNV